MSYFHHFCNITKNKKVEDHLFLMGTMGFKFQVRFNDGTANPAHFTTGLIGKDNAIARHGIHGLYWLYAINVPSLLLRRGDNTIYLTQSRSRNPFQGVMYDYIRLEGPPLLNIFNTDLEEALDFSRLSTTQAVSKPLESVIKKILNKNLGYN